MTTLFLDTSELREGDVVNCHGMRCLIDQEIKANEYSDRTVYFTSAKVLNLDELKENGFVGGVISLGWLYPDVFRGGWEKDWDADPRWDIQGNEHAMWQVERD